MAASKGPQNKSVLDEDNYFRVTTVHGFRYLVDRRSALDRFLWAFVIAVGFVYAGYLIHANFKDWRKNPVLTTIASTSTPVQSVQFPTITVCPGAKSEPDRWSFVQEMLNGLEFECDGKVGFDCDAKTGKVRDLFKELLEGTFGNMVRQVEVFYSDTVDFEMDENSDGRLVVEALNGRDTDNEEELLEEERILKAAAAIALNDQFDSMALRVKSRRAIAKNLAKFKYYTGIAFDSSGQEISTPGVLSQVVWPLLEESSPSNETFYNEAFESCRNDTICNDELSNWIKLLIATRKSFKYTRFGGVGTYVSNFAYLLGSTFRFENAWPTKPQPGVSPMEDKFQQIFVELFRNITGIEDTPVSLIDVPALLSPLIPNMEMLRNSFNFYGWRSQAKYSTHKSEVCHQDPVLEYGKEWLYYLYFDGQHPCKRSDREEMNPCCGYWGGILGRDLEGIMRIMRYSAPLPRSVRESIPSYDFIGEDYTRKSKEDQNPLNILKLLPSCFSSGSTYALECRNFRPTLTTEGVCASYNAKSLDEMASFPYSEMFRRVFDLGNETYEGVKMAEGDGDKFGFSFYLDGNTRARPTYVTDVNNALNPQNRRSSFSLSLGSASQYVDADRNVVQIHPGRHTIIKAIPTQITAQENIRSVSIKDRGCRFEDEIEGIALFKSYSQSGCRFERLLNHSRATCGCVPWNYPRLLSSESDDVPLCDLFGSLCFKLSMADVKVVDDVEHCPPDCNAVTFTFSESSTTIDPDEACSAGFVSRHVRQKFDDNWYPIMFRSLEDQVESKNLGKLPSSAVHLTQDEEERRLCVDALQKDLALVTVKLGSPTLVTSVRSRKTTFAEQLATFGGTVGLFTGMSFLSAFEIVFWIKRGIARIFK